MLKMVDNAVFTGVKDLVNNQFAAGHRELGLAEGGVDLTYSRGIEIPEEIVERVEEAKRAIIAGEIVVPSTRAEL